MKLADAEREKYTQIWNDVPAYRDISPGLDLVEPFCRVLEPKPGSTIIDIGCGEGVAGLEFERRGMDVYYLDITDAGLRPEVLRDRFVHAPLWSRWNTGFKYGLDYGFCCDVMEHIPPEFTMLVADRIVSACRVTWFQIAFLEDSHGAAINKPLHLTVKPFNWWLERLRMVGSVVDARDICGRGVFVVLR